MAKRRRCVKVDFSPKSAFYEPPADSMEDAVRALYIVTSGMGFALKEILATSKRSVKREMMQRLRVEFRELGESLIALGKEIEK